MAGVIIIMLITASIEVPALLRQKAYRAFFCFSLLWVVAFVYAALAVLKVPLPTVVETLSYIYSLIP